MQRKIATVRVLLILFAVLTVLFVILGIWTPADDLAAKWFQMGLLSGVSATILGIVALME